MKDINIETITPPHAIDVEQAVLGAMLLDSDSIVEIADILKPEMFYKDSHRKIYSIILEKSDNFQPIDLVTIVEELDKNNELKQAGGAIYITQLTNKVPSAAHIEFHARIIIEKYILRELQKLSIQLHSRSTAKNADVDNCMSFIEKKIDNIVNNIVDNECEHINIILKQESININNYQDENVLKDDIHTGFNKLDSITDGFQKTDLIILAARPSMGKTAFMISIVINIALCGIPVAIYSLEMSRLQLVQRIITAYCEINYKRIKNNKLDNEEYLYLGNKLQEMESLPIYIDDTPALSILDAKIKLKRDKRKHDIQIAFFDYLQLMNAGEKTQNRDREIGIITGGLKAMAKDLNIPVIALSQLNRAIDTRSGNKRPQLSDLRESGNIEQDADLIMFLHRAERYGLLEDEEGNSLKGIAEIIIAKHRNGAIGDFKMKFIDYLAKFTDLDPIEDDNLDMNNDYVYNSAEILDAFDN